MSFVAAILILIWTAIAFCGFYWINRRIYLLKHSMAAAIVLGPAWLVWFILWALGMSVVVIHISDTSWWSSLIVLCCVIPMFGFSLVAAFSERGIEGGWRYVLEGADMAWWPKNTWHNYVPAEDPESGESFL